MKCIALGLFLFTFVVRTFGQCDSTVSQTDDTVRTVKAKLACFAAENSNLRQQLADTQQELSNLKSSTPAFSIYGAQFDPKTLSYDTCKSKAVDSITKRGGAFARQDQNFVHLTLGSDWILINCNSTDYSGYVLVMGSSPGTSDQDLSEALVREVFP